MFIDVYAIHNVPPSNINRDDTGSPKTAMYGGVLRSRVSSQAWKRAMREMFPTLLPEGSLGVRTKLIVRLLAEQIAELRPDLADSASDYAVAVLTAAGVKVKKSTRQGSDKESDETGYLIFISRAEIRALARVAVEWADQGIDLKKVDAKLKKKVSSAFKGHQAVDVALFGRMLAEAPDFNTDASAQVAHAISVDRITQEYDYFTAVDDCAAEDNAGAGMIGTVDFNSSTLYRYATVNVDALFEQLEDAEATTRACAAFVDAFVRSMPTGKQNTFANRTLPSTVCVAVRSDQPINVVGAFEDPVRPIEGMSISRQAATRLAEELDLVEGAYAQPADGKWCTTVEKADSDELSALGERMGFKDLIDQVSGAVASHLQHEEER
ncbi:type I-E CRISPR-associated protein Cas7/Cse4/CasC [Collinsella ihumii]|uniref:type I-E CRISPR-associated protein Cas7/Cse4/CasC n=1 Tax=Collinsella ihumii TaxID=1720204 RepID=UPI00083753FC|nr:type I-E CRISPR-associated protein Cas7/Cse4/CasC [Collinsella ihumii]